MRNLVLLLVMLLSGGAGWWAGGRSGHDAREALAAAQALGLKAQQAHAAETQALQQKLTEITRAFEAGQQARDAQHAQAKSALDSALASRDKTIAELQRSTGSKQTRIVEIERRVSDTSLPAAERDQLRAEVERLNQEVGREKARVAGLECSKVAVPAELLAPLQVGG